MGLANEDLKYWTDSESDVLICWLKTEHNGTSLMVSRKRHDNLRTAPSVQLHQKKSKFYEGQLTKRC